MSGTGLLVAADQPNPLVDTSTALELMAEIDRRVERAELARIAAALEDKSRRLAVLLDGGAAGLGDADWCRVLRSCLPSRRRSRQILDQVGVAGLGAAVADLLDRSDPFADRLARFDEVLAGVPRAQIDLPFELLHFAAPERYWLWSRWIWDPRTGTGALCLLMGDDVDLAGGLQGAEQGAERAAAYRMAGEASAVVASTGRALGLFDDNPFSLDVFLACVYGIYMYTVLRMRMTQEFNRIVPELPDLVRRLLGVHRDEREVASPCQ